MTDIVERLRDCASPYGAMALVHQAADEIERLQTLLEQPPEVVIDGLKYTLYGSDREG